MKQAVLSSIDQGGGKRRGDGIHSVDVSEKNFAHGASYPHFGQVMMVSSL